MPYERENIRQLQAYTPGEQPQQQRVIKLNTNENPYPPSQAVLDAISHVTAEQLRRYPPPSAVSFRQTAARVHGLHPDQIIATNGGDELLRLAITVFCEPQPDGPGGLGIGEPSYSLYPVLAKTHNTSVTRVSLNDDFSLPDNFADALNEAGCRLAMIVNPHAPSGRLQPLEQIEAVARAFNGVLLVDEAYVDFATSDATALLDESRGLDNVLLLRTLSKGYSLAGLRFGYGMGHHGIIAALHKARDSYNVDMLAQAAAVAALENREVARKTWQAVIEERGRLTAELTARGFFVYPSQSNFVLAVPGAAKDASGKAATHPTTKVDAKTIYETLKQQAIFVRYFQQERLEDKLRITVGAPAENDALLAALDQL